MTRDPLRLLEDPSFDSALRADLSVASEAQLQGFDHAAGLAQLEAATATSAGASGGLSLAAKLGLGSAVTGVAVGAWLLGSDPQTDVEATKAATSEIATVAHVADAAVEAAPRGPAAAAAIPQPIVEPEPEPAQAPVDSDVDPEPEQPVEPVEAEPPSPVVATATPNKRTEDAAGHREPRTAEPSPPADPINAVLKEAQMLAKARAALGGNSAKALSLTREVAEEFPNGQLVEERLAIEIQALVGVGRLDEAKTLATSFLSHYGRGAHATAVRRAIGDDE